MRESQILGLSESEKKEYIMQEQKLDREERAAIREAERIAREDNMKLRELEVIEAEKQRAHELELAKLNSGQAIGTERTAGQQGEANGASLLPNVPKFRSGEKIEPFIARFEDMSAKCRWNQDWKAIQFMSCFSDKPLDIIMRIEADDRSFDKMKDALLKAYGMSAGELRKQFLQAKIQEKETASQFVTRLTGYFKHWVDKDGADKSYDGLQDLLIRTVFENSCSQELVSQLRARKAKTVSDMTEIAEAQVAGFGASAFKVTTAAPAISQHNNPGAGINSQSRKQQSRRPYFDIKQSQKPKWNERFGRSYQNNYYHNSSGSDRQRFGANEARQVASSDVQRYQGHETRDERQQTTHTSGAADIYRNESQYSRSTEECDYAPRSGHRQQF